MKSNVCFVGLDVGSTTVKIVVTDGTGETILYSAYKKHDTQQVRTAADLLTQAHRTLPDRSFSVAVCGSGGQPVADALNAFFVQEVVALSTVVGKEFPDVRTAIELGGQDAKVVTMDKLETSETLEPLSMRMNGVCAGGTGAFIDQIASLLNLPSEDFNAYAETGTHVYDISGRCGVFAKTDIQPLLNSGASVEDLALSTYHSIARQTISGLAQGMQLRPKILFAGGPFTYHPRLIDVFREKLNWTHSDILLPKDPELLVARGAALCNRTVFGDMENRYEKSLIEGLYNNGAGNADSRTSLKKFFASPEELEGFLHRHRQDRADSQEIPGGEALWLGIDAGSTTCKFVLIDNRNSIVHSYYANNQGDPLKVLFRGLKDYYTRETAQGAVLPLLAGIGVTGYGANLMEQALKADLKCVETVAHSTAARTIEEDVSAIIDIGGQDMKVIFIEEGIITDIIINEACSAGCGSFLESYAGTLGVPVSRISELALSSESPPNLGSRCTVFMNSAVISAQKNGAAKQDILAGLCHSVVENLFTKLLRPDTVQRLGNKIVVQGGTFLNNAVLRATEQFLGMEVIRPERPEFMGAMGAALLAKDDTGAGMETGEAGRLREICATSYERKKIAPCSLCANKCIRSLVEFSHGGAFISGNRCERGAEVSGKPPAGKRKHKGAEDLLDYKSRLVFSDFSFTRIHEKKNFRIGIPRALDMWESAPFWTTFFKALGFEVVLSSPSSPTLYAEGLPFVSSDTICLPAKLSHGHIESLLKKKADAVFLPQMIYGGRENKSSEHGFYCAILQGYSMVLDNMHEPDSRQGVPFFQPIFHWYSPAKKRKQIADFIREKFKIPEKTVHKAIIQGEVAMAELRNELLSAGKRVLKDLEDQDRFGIVIAARPYHSDRSVNHGISRYLTDAGIPVLVPEAVPRIAETDLSSSRMESVITYHNRMIESAIGIAEHPRLEALQIVSFGCGHDAVISDEFNRILKERGRKSPLILKLDESTVSGPLHLRINSFIETVKQRKKLQRREKRKDLSPEIKGPQYTKEDKNGRTIYAPNLSVAFTHVAAAVIARKGCRIKPLPVANERSIHLGKKFVHNDICYPAQINVGEFLSEVEAGRIDPKDAALGLAKNCESCRAGQYHVVARKALDDAGLRDVPIITTGKDTKELHPGFKLTLLDQLNIAWGITLTDELERIRRRIRPYEREPGAADRLFSTYLEKICRSFVDDRKGALAILAEGIEEFNRLPTVQQNRRPRVGIIGEILMNYHPGANNYIENYLERHGMETKIPDMLLFFRKEYVIDQEIAKRGWSPNPLLDGLINTLSGDALDAIRSKVRKIGEKFKFFEPHTMIGDIAGAVEGKIDLTYRGAEGWKIPGEILTMIKEGIRSFVIIQPFGCLPNHITGRGFEKYLKSLHKDIQILSLDYDPDISRANIENRLQMLIMREKMKAS